MPKPKWKLLKKGLLVLVEWDDITQLQADDWNDHIEYGPRTVITPGYLAADLTRKSQYVFLGWDLDVEEGTFHTSRKIPLGVVIDISPLDRGASLWD